MCRSRASTNSGSSYILKYRFSIPTRSIASCQNGDHRRRGWHTGRRKVQRRHEFRRRRPKPDRARSSRAPVEALPLKGVCHRLPVSDPVSLDAEHGPADRAAAELLIRQRGTVENTLRKSSPKRRRRASSSRPSSVFGLGPEFVAGSAPARHPVRLLVGKGGQHALSGIHGIPPPPRRTRQVIISPVLASARWPPMPHR